MNLMIMSWGTLAGVFLAPYLYGLFWKRTTLAGVVAGIAVGLACAFTLFTQWGPDGVPLAGAITMLLPLIVVPLVSLVTPPSEKGAGGRGVCRMSYKTSTVSNIAIRSECSQRLGREKAAKPFQDCH